MELSREPAPVPGTRTTGERIARGATFVFLALAAVALTFGLGYGVSELRDDDPVATAPIAIDDGAVASADSDGAAILDEIFDILETQFVDRDLIDPESLREAAIRGAIASLNDPHTDYLTPSDLASGALDLGATYDGIGASVTDRTGVVEIVAPFRGSPAEEAGIRAGDIILAVDGEPTDGWTDQQAVQRIRGPRGTAVTLTVRHTDLGDGGTGPEVEDIVITRGEILIESVFIEPILEVIPGETGTDLVDHDGNLVSDLAYVNISQYHEETLAELRVALSGVESSGVSGLIVDLRSNPGGLLSATVDVTNEFMDAGVILIERDADGSEQVFSGRDGGLATQIPLVVLIDQASASGSEVMAAALKDAGRATIVGTRSFGKGTVNQLRELTSCGDPGNCGAIYVSVARWLRPSGEEIEGIGIRPDIEVEMSGDDYIEQGDLQLFAAIDALRDIIANQ